MNAAAGDPELTDPLIDLAAANGAGHDKEAQVAVAGFQKANRLAVGERRRSGCYLS
jgi:hypothetical protein